MYVCEILRIQFVSRLFCKGAREVPAMSAAPLKCRSGSSRFDSGCKVMLNPVVKTIVYEVLSFVDTVRLRYWQATTTWQVAIDTLYRQKH